MSSSVRKLPGAITIPSRSRMRVSRGPHGSPIPRDSQVLQALLFFLGLLKIALVLLPSMLFKFLAKNLYLADNISMMT